MNAQSLYEIQQLAGDLYRIGVVSHDQRERLEHLAAQNPQFAAALRVAARTEGLERQERILALVGPPSGTPPPTPDSPQRLAVPPAPPHGPGVHDPAYTDAYQVAGTLETVGSLAKVLGSLVLFGAGVAFFLLIANGELGLALGLPLMLAGVVFGFVFLFVGVLLSAQGQLLRASLDTAANTAKMVRLLEHDTPS